MNKIPCASHNTITTVTCELNVRLSWNFDTYRLKVSTSSKSYGFVNTGAIYMPSHELIEWCVILISYLSTLKANVASPSVHASAYWYPGTIILARRRIFVPEIDNFLHFFHILNPPFRILDIFTDAQSAKVNTKN